jgi:hypothetical protein
MRATPFFMVLLAPLWTTVACNGEDSINTVDTSDVRDTEGPEIDTEALGNPQIIGTDLTVEANITDELGKVQQATIFFKRETSVTWEHAIMTQTSEESSQWVGVIPAESVSNAAGMHYYLWAQDDSLNETFKPEHGPDDPYHFTLDSKSQ